MSYLISFIKCTSKTAVDSLIVSKLVCFTLKRVFRVCVFLYKCPFVHFMVRKVYVYC